jgi:Uma2 family endonuclease
MIHAKHRNAERKTKPGRSRSLPPRLRSVLGRPTWDVASLYPEQGAWSEEAYLALDTNHLIEFTDGVLDFLPMPTMSHQAILIFLLTALRDFCRPAKLGAVSVAGLRVRIRPGAYREPDIVFMLARHANRMNNEYWIGADLVMEVVSDTDDARERDLHEKRLDYAAARIPEYWIVDPKLGQITVPRLKGAAYVKSGVFRGGERAASNLLKGFSVNVDEVFHAPME